MRCIALAVVPVALLVGSVGHYADAASPSRARETKSSTPSDEEVRQSYSEFRQHLLCPDTENCDNLLWQNEPRVSRTSVQACTSVRKSGALRCKFIVFQMVPFESDQPVGDIPTGTAEKMHFCAGLFRRNQGEWTMLTLYGKCYPDGEASAP